MQDTELVGKNPAVFCYPPKKPWGCSKTPLGVLRIDWKGTKTPTEVAS